jgi:predicted nucleotidyltransferase
VSSKRVVKLVIPWTTPAETVIKILHVAKLLKVQEIWAEAGHEYAIDQQLGPDTGRVFNDVCGADQRGSVARATMVVMQTAERVIATLRAHGKELRQAGLRSLSLFGSVARGDTEMDSDIDLAAEFDPAARMDLLQLSAVERRLAELLGSPVL